MDIDFLLENEGIDSLCFHYITNSKQKQKSAIVNSILMELVSSTNGGFYQLFNTCLHIIDDNATSSDSSNRSSTEKEYLTNMADLLKQIINKYPKILQKLTGQQLCTILKFIAVQILCTVCSNSYIHLLHVLVTKLPHSLDKTSLQILQQIIYNNKIQISLYKQVSRLYLYGLLALVIKHKHKQSMTVQFIKKTMSIIQSEKDPRNILYVFQIYELILNHSPQAQLIPISNQIFQNLQQYYPIDFEGDTSKHSISLQDISLSLDRCLTHPIFTTQLKCLLMTKMGAAPIGKYISTFISSNNTIDNDICTFWSSLLARTTQEQYLLQQYQQNAQYTLSDLVVQLLNRLITQNQPICYSIYTHILQYMDKLIVAHIYNYQHNDKYAGVVINIVKQIMSKCNSNIQYIFISYCIQGFINYWQHSGDIIYKLGILVPVLQSTLIGQYDIENIGFLILTLSQIYYKTQEQEQQPRIIILKIYMQLGTNSTSLKMINQTNIYHTCIQTLNKLNNNSNNGHNSNININSNSNIIVNGNSSISNNSNNNSSISNNIKIIMKSYLDFIVQIYPNSQLTCATICSMLCPQIKLYGLILLCSKIPSSYSILIQYLTHIPQGYQQLAILLKHIKLIQILDTIAHIPIALIPQHILPTIKSIVESKYKWDNTNTGAFVIEYINTYTALYVSTCIWRQGLLIQALNCHIRNIIIKWLTQQYQSITIKDKHIHSQQSNNIHNDNNINTISKYCINMIAYYNKSIQVFGIKTPIDINTIIQQQHININNNNTYQQQLYRMLPIQQNHKYTPQQCKQWPTLIHYCWLNNTQYRQQLLPYLPTSILAAQANKILPIIINNNNIQTLAKIITNLPISEVTQSIVPFVIKYVCSTGQHSDVEDIVAVNKILHTLQQISKQNQTIRSTLIKNKGKILVAIEDKILQHKKRRARQSGRTVFSLYNNLK